MSALIDSLTQLLERDTVHLSSLEQILKEERSALESHDSQQLHSVVAQKEQTTQQIQGSAREKAELFSRHGLKFSPEHIKSALIRLNRPEVLDLWNRVTAQLEHCQHLNEINGRIVFRSQQSISRMIDILRGQDQQQKLYGQNGRGGNSLGSSNLLANA